MSSRRTARQLVVAILLGVLVGGGLMAVTPAGAEVTQAVATNWKKIWKKKLRPLADRRYYTEAESDAKYQPKGSYEAAGSGYTKAESDARYAPYPKTLRGTYIVSATAAGAGEFAFNNIAFPAALATAPTTVVFKPVGGPANPSCTGTALAPEAAPGVMCIYEGSGTNYTNFTFANAGAGTGVASPFGIVVRISSVAAGLTATVGGWAVTPANGVTARSKAPRTGGRGFLGN